MSKLRAFIITMTIGYVLLLHLGLLGFSTEGVKVRDVPGIVKSIPARLLRIPQAYPTFWWFFVNYGGLTLIVCGLAMLLIYYYGAPSGILCLDQNCDHQH